MARNLVNIQGKTIEEQIQSIDGILTVLLRRDRLMDQKVVRAAGVITEVGRAAEEAKIAELEKIAKEVKQTSQDITEAVIVKEISNAADQVPAS